MSWSAQIRYTPFRHTPLLSSLDAWWGSEDAAAPTNKPTTTTTNNNNNNNDNYPYQ